MLSRVLTSRSRRKNVTAFSRDWRASDSRSGLAQVRPSRDRAQDVTAEEWQRDRELLARSGHDGGLRRSVVEILSWRTRLITGGSARDPWSAQ